MSLSPENRPEEWTRPDPTDQESLDYVCDTLDDVECARWIACCEDGVACCQSQLANTNITAPGYCHRTWDGYSCWEDTKAGTEANQSCPEFLAFSAPSRKYNGFA